MNATQASLLAILDGYGGELTGGELVRVAELRIGQSNSLTRSQVHRELAALERDGLVVLGTPGATDPQPYLTASGDPDPWARVLEWFATLPADVRPGVHPVEPPRSPQPW